MKNLIILESTVHALEMAEIVERINPVAPTWKLLGYIAADKHTDHIGKQFNGYPVLGTRVVPTRYPDAMLVPNHEYQDPIDLPPERFATIIDPTAFVSRTAQIAGGCVIYPHCYIGHNTRLGHRVFMLDGTVINHDNVIEDNVTIASRVTLAGHVTVESGSYLGQSCTIRQFLRMGKECYIGMGCVVVKDVEPRAVMAGNPARKLCSRDQIKKGA